MWSVLAGQDQCHLDDTFALPTVLISLPTNTYQKTTFKPQAKMIRFVWGDKGHSFSKEILFHLKKQGGLGLPNLWLYYQAAQLAQFYIIYSKGQKPDWVFLEQGCPNL